MADTTKEILTLEDKTSVRMRGQVVNVFPMESGKVKSGKRMGEDWWRQDLVLRDAEGEAKVQWWSPGPTETMTILQGMQVEVHGKVNAWIGRNNEVHKDVRCSGNDAVRPLDGATLYQPPGATNSPPPAQGTSQGQKVAQNASGAVQRQDSGVPTDREMVAWLREAGKEVAAVVCSWGDPTTPHGEAAVITTVGSILTGMRIGAEHGKLRLTYGEEPPAPARSPGPPDPDPNNGAEIDDYDDIPF